VRPLPPDGSDDQEVGAFLALSPRVHLQVE